MKNSFTICIDMDDTIEDLLSAIIDWLNKKHNLNIKLENVTSWDLKDTFCPYIKENEIYEPLYDREFWKTVKPKPDAVKYIKKLIDENQKIYILTCSHYKTIDPKIEEVLFKYFPYLSWRNIITASTKQMINCDILIDDGIHNLLGGKYFGILFDCQSNKNCPCEKDGIIRAHNWEEVYKIIETLDIIYSKYNIKTTN